MDEEDNWNPEFEGQSILKAKVINFTNDSVEHNLELYNSIPTPHQDLEQDSDEGELQQPPEIIEAKNDIPQESLYDPLKDEHGQSWVFKHLQKSEEYSRPLSCPGCFTPLCYSYKQCTESGSQHLAKQVVNCTYNPMPYNYQANTTAYPSSSNLQGVSDRDLQIVGDLLSRQEQQIDLKFQLKCSECQNVVGVYESQKGQYRLFDLI